MCVKCIACARIKKVVKAGEKWVAPLVYGSGTAMWFAVAQLCVHLEHTTMFHSSSEYVHLI